MRIEKAGIQLIKKWEGFKSKPYLCSAGVPSIGYGSTYYRNGTKVTLKDKAITEPEANSLMIDILDRDFVPKIDKLVHVEIGQKMFDALCAFAYNVGIGGFTDSTLLKKVNSLDFAGASAEFPKWNKAKNKDGTKVAVQGLTNRRADERKLFDADIKRTSNG